MPRKILHSIALLAALCFFFPVNSTAQTNDRAQAIAEIESLREQIKAREALLLAPAPEDREAHAEFLAQAGTGLVRLLPREKWDGKLSLSGGGAYYSFTRLTHEYGFGSDISFEQGQLRVGFAGANFGFLTNLGNVPVDGVTLETEGVRYMAAFNPPTAEPGAREQKRRTSAGFEVDEASYKSSLPVHVRQTYVVRSIDYYTSDVLVAFRVVRKDQDGSLILLWKMLKKFEKPGLERSAPAAVAGS